MELINGKLIEVDSNIKCKEDSIEMFVEKLYKNKRIVDKEGFLEDVYKREREMSTSMGMGVAIPHAQSKYVSEPSLVFIKLQEAIHWNNDDNVKLIFGIAVPIENEDNQHLKILSILARKLMDDTFREHLFALNNKNEAMTFLSFLNYEC